MKKEVIAWLFMGLLVFLFAAMISSPKSNIAFSPEDGPQEEAYNCNAHDYVQVAEICPAQTTCTDARAFCRQKAQECQAQSGCNLVTYDNDCQNGIPPYVKSCVDESGVIHTETNSDGAVSLEVECRVDCENKIIKKPEKNEGQL